MDPPIGLEAGTLLVILIVESYSTADSVYPVFVLDTIGLYGFSIFILCNMISPVVRIRETIVLVCIVFLT